MTTTIDAAGRLVIPKAVRDAAGIRAGMPLEVRFRDGRIEVEPAPIDVDIVARGSVTVAVSKKQVPPLSAADVDAVRARLRDER